jgi:type IV pilus assembly protein PilM
MFENFFKRKSNYFVGVDFGSSTVKIIELSFKDQKIRLENYGWVDLNNFENSLIGKLESQNNYLEKLQICLKELQKQMKLKAKGVYVSLPAYNGLVNLVEFPEMKKEELEKAIQFEARKYIPASLDEIALDWDILPESDEPLALDKNNSSPAPSASHKNKILLVAAPKKEVIRYGNIVRSAGLEVNAIELETFSMARALVGEDRGTFIIIDMGSNSTNIVLVDKGTVRTNRNIDTGGSEITNTIADSLNISKQRADSMKKEDKDLINSKDVPLAIPALDLISNEIKRIVTAYKEKIGEVRIDGIILSGGSGRMKGLDQYFYKTLGIKAVIGNPWRKISYDQKLEPLIDKIRISFTVAIGLAFRGIEENKKN